MNQQEQQIERYLNGEMTASELADFELQLDQNSQLASALQSERQNRTLVQMAGRNHLKTRLEKIDQQLAPSTKSRSFLSRRNWWLLAACLLVLVTATYFGLSLQTSSKQSLFAEYFEVYRSPVNSRGQQDDNQVLWNQATMAYQNGDYPKAHSIFEQLLAASDSLAVPVHFYQGLCLLAQSQPDAIAAIQSFDQVIGSASPYEQQALWYKALAHLQLNDNPATKEILEKIIQEKTYNHQAATQLLSTLNVPKGKE